MNKTVKLITPLLMFSLLLTACGSSSKSNSSLPSEDRTNYSTSDFSFSDDNSSETNSYEESSAAATSVSTSADIKNEPITTTTKEQIGMVINPNKNKILYLKLDWKTKVDNGYNFSYSIDNTTSDKMTFTVTSVKCGETDITDATDLSRIELEGLQSACGEFAITSPLLNESSVFHIIGDWTNETGVQIFTDFSYTFNMDLINTY